MSSVAKGFSDVKREFSELCYARIALWLLFFGKVCFPRMSRFLSIRRLFHNLEYICEKKIIALDLHHNSVRTLVTLASVPYPYKCYWLG